MAINLYLGLMGSGKTYQVVKEPILQALKKGRRVVTNINGLNPELCYAYISKQFPNIEKIGEIVNVTDEQIKEPEFFPIDKQLGFVKGGDLVVIDEAWRYWPSGETLNSRHLEFFTKHRHYTNENHDTCDVCLVIQESSLLARQVKALCEMTFYTRKQKALGMPKFFTLIIYDGNKQTKTSIISNGMQKYNPDIFPLYKSYASGKGNEQIIDDRTNIFKSKKLWFSVVLGILGICYSFYTMNKLVSGKLRPEDTKKTQVAGKDLPLNGFAPAIKPVETGPLKQTELRIAGVIDSTFKRIVFIKNSTSGQVTQIYYDNNCINKGLLMSCIFDNKIVTVYSSNDTGANNANNQNNIIPINNKK